MRERRVVLSGPPDVVADELQKLADQVRNNGPNPALYVEGNGAGADSLALEIDAEESYREEGGARLLAEFG